MANGIHLKVGVNDKISLWESTSLGLQNILVMNFYIVPLMFAGALGLSGELTTTIISITFITIGIATLIQAGWGIKLPVIQGPSFLPMGAMVVISKAVGIGTMFGSAIPAAILIALLGPLKLMNKFVKFFLSPLVAATIVMVVGIAVGTWGVNDWVGADGNIISKGLIFLITLGSLLFFFSVGQKVKGLIGKLSGIFAILLSILIGTIVANMFGLVDFSIIGTSSWFSFPQFFYFGSLGFNLNAALVFVLLYLALLLEALGMWYAVASATESELDEKRLNGATMGEGLGCFFASLFGGMPVCGYTDNIAIITITGIASRWVAIATGVLAIILGLFPKLMSFFTCIPKSVLGTVVMVISATIIMNGVRLIKTNVDINERNLLVIGIPVITTLAASSISFEMLEILPPLLQYFLGSALSVGIILALLLNILIPKSEEEITVESPANNEVSLN